MPHCAHDDRKIAGPLQHPGSVIVAPSKIQDKFFRKPCFTTSLAEFLVQGCQMSRSREGLEDTALATWPDRAIQKGLTCYGNLPYGE